MRMVSLYAVFKEYKNVPDDTGTIDQPVVPIEPTETQKKESEQKFLSRMLRKKTSELADLGFALDSYSRDLEKLQ